jgi:hypothetical protein
VCVRDPMPARGVLWTRLWPCRAATGPTSPGAAGVSQRPSWSAAYSSHRRPDNDRPETGLDRGIGAVRRAHSTGTADHADGGDVPARSCRCGHPITRRSESLSWV